MSAGMIKTKKKGNHCEVYVNKEKKNPSLRKNIIKRQKNTHIRSNNH